MLACIQHLFFWSGFTGQKHWPTAMTKVQLNHSGRAFGSCISASITMLMLFWRWRMQVYTFAVPGLGKLNWGWNVVNFYDDLCERRISGYPMYHLRCLHIHWSKDERLWGAAMAISKHPNQPSFMVDTPWQSHFWCTLGIFVWSGNKKQYEQQHQCENMAFLQEM